MKIITRLRKLEAAVLAPLLRISLPSSQVSHSITEIKTLFRRARRDVNPNRLERVALFHGKTAKVPKGWAAVKGRRLEPGDMCYPKDGYGRWKESDLAKSLNPTFRVRCPEFVYIRRAK